MKTTKFLILFFVICFTSGFIGCGDKAKEAELPYQSWNICEDIRDPLTEHPVVAMYVSKDKRYNRTEIGLESYIVEEIRVHDSDTDEDFYGYYVQRFYNDEDARVTSGVCYDCDGIVLFEWEAPGCFNPGKTVPSNYKIVERNLIYANPLLSDAQIHSGSY